MFVFTFTGFTYEKKINLNVVNRDKCSVEHYALFCVLVCICKHIFRVVSSAYITLDLLLCLLFEMCMVCLKNVMYVEYNLKYLVLYLQMCKLYISRVAISPILILFII